jgi:predicted permease
VLHVWEGERVVISPPNFLDAQARTKTLSSAAAYDTNSVVLTGEGDPVSLTRADVTAGFFETLGTPPLLGRVLKPGENETGRQGVVVLSHRLWQQRFNGDPELIGRNITLHGRSNEVVGIMPPEFDWPIGADLWAPVEYTEAFTSTNRGAWYLEGVGRLAPGVTLEEAQAEFSGIAAQLEQEYPGPNTKVGLAVYPLLDGLVGDSERGLLVLLAAVGFVLLIACANVANLLLARASARRDELSVRLALGARRGHLVRQLVVEGLLLAAAGGAAGLMLATWATHGLAALSLDIPRLDATRVGGTMLAFTLGATLLTGMLFSLAPSLFVTGRTMAGALSERGRSGTGSRRSQRLRSTLVVVETALAVILLAGAGLLIRSFVKLSHVDPGFNASSAITFRVSLPEAAYAGDEARIAFYDGLRERSLAVPGVTAVATTLAVPPAGERLNLSFDIAGRPPHAPGTDPTLEVSVVDADYFGVMGIPVVRGRGFTADDRLSTPTTLVLTESAVRRYFPDEDPLGQHITLGWRRAGTRVGSRHRAG